MHGHYNYLTTDLTNHIVSETDVRSGKRGYVSSDSADRGLPGVEVHPCKGQPVNPNTAVLPLSSSSMRRHPHVSSLPQHHRRRRTGAAMTLYVRTNSDDDNDRCRPSIETAEGTAAEECPHSATAECSGISQKILVGLQAVADAPLTAIGFLQNASQIVRRKSYVTEIFVFLFFMLVFIFIVHTARGHAEGLQRIAERSNHRGILFAVSLVEEQLARATEARKLMAEPSGASPGAIKNATEALREVAALRKMSVQQLHARMLYPGPVEDIEFLLEEHVAYKNNLLRLIQEEMKWLENRKRVYFNKAKGPVVMGHRGKGHMKSAERTESSTKEKATRRSSTKFSGDVHFDSGEPTTASHYDITLNSRLWSLLSSRIIAVFFLLSLVALYHRLS
ncbi:hypothetical protein ERJ75_000193600 [Trypanosoma vivax]|uniref:Uncharacterized protein n=1 Tax=Trypanosoma vivax (strain Y486) TaxID=1055687 RepID=G0UA40_TRYVY|nr:hypothetical protein TRVL_03123 [Trypanosoma vivax]KAH8619011.1 hypothetical protein ERJ75_000193600 [Trypanosoma vivax]CCC52672.1 conserved hypothetical protein [Trypanosoma vivax Y486]